ncbi:hypothetical protein HMPREF9946_01880 [Acetobacteraceae bacterium AT-5844]|nr:hypothetical protein HMPREF9946_01880 [Acetobacteraceae bacterium AT-5844]
MTCPAFCRRRAVKAETSSTRLNGVNYVAYNSEWRRFPELSLKVRG